MDDIITAQHVKRFLLLEKLVINRDIFRSLLPRSSERGCWVWSVGDIPGLKKSVVLAVEPRPLI